MRNKKLFYGSSYDRGLIHLLNMWPDIIERYPDATLSICYGWDLFLKGYSTNPERMAWKDKVDKLMEQNGITHHGRVGKDKLKEIRKECGIWVYPTHFTEINCITALECQDDGLVPVVINLAALEETVGSGSKIEGDIYDPMTKERFKEELFKYMDDEKLWQKESESAKNFAKGYDWSLIAKEWGKHL